MTDELKEAKARLAEALANPLANTTLVYSGYGVRIADLRTLLSALSRGAGWVLVPREPTEAMQEAGGRSIAHPSVYMGGAGPNRRKLAAQYYRAMIAAAPPVPEGEE